MNQQTVADIFNEFLQRHLASLGFVSSSPTLAERILTGFSQVIRWKFCKLGTASTFDLYVHFSYSHDLDDALSITASNEERKPACSGCVRVLHMTDALTKDDLINGLKRVHGQLQNILDRTQSVAQIYTAVNDDLSIGSTLLGHDQMGMSFNYAYCMEVAGMKREAAQAYAQLSVHRRSNRSAFATRLRKAARDRAMTLQTYLSDVSQGQLANSASSTAERIPLVADTISETELAKSIIAQCISPEVVLPGKFLEAITQAYLPATAFWLNVDAGRLVSELEGQHPAYMEAVNREWSRDGCGSFTEDLVNAICTRQFDEYAARWLLSLPHEQVSNDDDDEVYELLHAHLKRTGNSTYLRYLELDGVKAIGYIRDRMDLLLS